MSRRYRRNGTPIGDHKVYALALRDGSSAEVFEVQPHGIADYEDLDALVMLEAMAGAFGYGYDRLVITKPGADLSGADLSGADLSGANLERAYYPSGTIPEGWRRKWSGHLTRV